MRVISALISLLLAMQGNAANEWRKSEQTDALRGTAYSMFALNGKFLTPPKLVSGIPEFVVKCVPGKHSAGFHVYTSGKIMDAYVIVRAVVNSGPNGAVVSYRLDDGKIHNSVWGTSTDGMGVFPTDADLSGLFFGHILRHKENSSPPVRKVVLAVDEYLGASIVMQFDLPDPTPVADECGMVLHKGS